MKTTLTAFCLLMALLCNAQYKKASFLTKNGRTHELTAFSHLAGSEISMIPGISYSYGRDKGKKVFHWFDLELLLPAKFSFNTVDLNSGDPVTYSGKTTFGLIYRYNFAYYLLDPSETKSKFLPFVTLGINALLGGGNVDHKTLRTSIESYDPQKIIVGQRFNYGANGGLGALYKFTDKTALKLNAGYNWQGSYRGEDGFEKGKYSFFEPFPSHIYVSAGIRFTIEED